MKIVLQKISDTILRKSKISLRGARLTQIMFATYRRTITPGVCPTAMYHTASDIAKDIVVAMTRET